MATQYALWTHGKATTVESPENLVSAGYNDWGAYMVIKPGKSAWFHLPLRSPKLLNSNAIRLLRTYLFFNASNCAIRNIHVYDGPVKVEEYNDLLLDNDHMLVKDHSNTFNLLNEHTVQHGIRISLFCAASTGFDAEISASRLVIGTARADYVTGHNFDVFSTKQTEIAASRQ